MNAKVVGRRVVQEVLLGEHRDDVTRAYLAAKIVSKDAKVKKLVTKLSEAVFKALPENLVKDVDLKGFKKEFVEGLGEWAVHADPTKNEMTKLRYELGLFVGEHNTEVLFKEVVPALKENPWNAKLSSVANTSN